MIFFTSGMGLLKFPPLGGRFERTMFIAVFSICWFMAGIAAIYANYLNDFQQLHADGGHFFWRSTHDIFKGMSLEALKLNTEGSGQVFIWRAVYNAFSFLGFNKGRYIGVLVNIFTVSFTGVVAVKMARTMYGNDASRFNRLILLFSCCGIFWLFAAIHMRDAAVLFVVTFLAYLWCLYLTKHSVRALIFVGAASSISPVVFSYLRNEFVFVPFAMFFAGLLATSLGKKVRGSRRIILNISFLLGFLFAVFILPDFIAELNPVMNTQHERYDMTSRITAASDSLGMSLILNQIFPIRLILSTVWILIFPIPFWSGFQLETAYHLFKSFNVIFMYLFIPLFTLSVLKVYRFKILRTPVILFNFFCAFGFLLAVAATSIETRHFAVFYVPLFLLALLPDLSLKKEQIAYKNLFQPFIAAILFIHIMWVFLKLF